MKYTNFVSLQIFNNLEFGPFSQFSLSSHKKTHRDEHFYKQNVGNCHLLAPFNLAIVYPRNCLEKFVNILPKALNTINFNEKLTH